MPLTDTGELESEVSTWVAFLDWDGLRFSTPERCANRPSIFCLSGLLDKRVSV